MSAHGRPILPPTVRRLRKRLQRRAGGLIRCPGLRAGERWSIELPSWYVGRHTDLLAELEHGVLGDRVVRAAAAGPTSLWIERSAVA